MLESWKAIGQYLGVSERTAQKWEAEKGLPVRRLGHQRGARVAAYISEVDAWRATQFSSNGKERRPLLLRVVIAAVLLLTAAISSAYLASLFQTDYPVSCQINGEQVSVFDAAGTFLWSVSVPGLDPSQYGDLSVPNGKATFVDIDEDGSTELLLTYYPKWQHRQDSGLLCFRDGQFLWKFEYGAALELDGSRYPARFAGSFIAVVKGNERRYLLACAQHVDHAWYQVALLDPLTGDKLAEYWHPGHFSQLAPVDVDKDGGDEIVGVGTNNAGNGLGFAAITVLDIPFRPNGRETSPGLKNPFGTQNQMERQYLLLSRPELYDVLEATPMAKTITPGENGYVVEVSQPGISTVFYSFDFDFNLIGVRVADDYRVRHQELFLSGIIDHPFSVDELETHSQVVQLPTAPFAASAPAGLLFDSSAPGD